MMLTERLLGRRTPTQGQQLAHRLQRGLSGEFGVPLVPLSR